MKKKIKISKKSVKKTVGIVPLGDRILIKPISGDEMKTSVSGIIIPDTVSKEKPEQGTVIAVGEGRWEGGKRIPVLVKVGDKVMYKKWGGNEIKVNGQEWMIVEQKDILAIVE